MHKLSSLRGLQRFRSLAGSASKAIKAANPRPSSNAGGSKYGSFANLKITAAAEKLVKEQASVKTDLEMAHTKLKGATEQVNLLEGKLQQAVNENAKLKVKQTEDPKLWQGLDSKVSSTKTLCDQLTETLQQLVCQTERAEEDKKLFEEKLGKNSTALDEFNCLLHDLSTKLECAKQTIISGKRQMLQIKHEKKEMDQSYKERLCANDTTLKEKDSLIKQLESSVDESKARLICLYSRLQCMEQELKLKDDVCISLKENLASAEGERNSLKLRNQDCSLEIAKLCKNNKDLNDLLSGLVAKVTELDKEHASMSSHVSRLLSSFERFQGMVQEEKMLIARSSKEKIEELQNQYVELMSENNGLKIEIEELKCRIIELQKTQEIVMVQHVEECQVAEDKIRRLESEAEISESNINRLEKLASELQVRIEKLLEESTVAENHQQELLEKISKLESDNQELVGKVQSIADEKFNNAESLQGEIAKRDQQVDTLESQVNQLRDILDEKEQLYSCSLEREKTLEEQKLQECPISLVERSDPYARNEHELQLASPAKQKDANSSGIMESPISNMSRKVEIEMESKINGGLKKSRSAVMDRSRRSFHSTAPKANSIKRKARQKMPPEKKPPNKARVKLNPKNWHASGRSLRRGLRKAQAWFKANGHHVDLSDYMGQGMEVVTTAPGGTFHMTFEFRDSELTLYLDGRNLYIKGWKSKNGLFEIQAESGDEKYIPDPSCKVIKTGVNYSRLCTNGKVEFVRIGPEAIMNFLDVLLKCDGTVSCALYDAISGLAVNVSESIRIEEVLKKVIAAFDNYSSEYQRLGPELAVWVKNYDRYSAKIMAAVNCLFDGLPVPVIPDLRDGSSSIPLEELLSIYSVLLRDANKDGKFVQEEKNKTSVFSPATRDVDEEAEEEDVVEEEEHGRAEASE